MTATGTITLTITYDVQGRNSEQLDTLGQALKEGAEGLAYRAVENWNKDQWSRNQGRPYADRTAVKNTTVRISKNISE